MVDDLSTLLGSRHAIVAGVIGGVVAIGDSLLGPVLAPVAELGAAALTAWIGAKAVCEFARVNGVERQRALEMASEATRDSYGAHLAHKPLDSRVLHRRAIRAQHEQRAQSQWHCVRAQSDVTRRSCARRMVAAAVRWHARRRCIARRIQRCDVRQCDGAKCQGRVS